MSNVLPGDSTLLHGRFDVGGRSLYLDCRGHHGPTIVIEVGLGYKPGTQHEGWFAVRDALLPYARVCLYDRAGQGQSDSPPHPLTIAEYVRDLYRLLRVAQLPPPYFLIGGSIGGLIVRLFGARYPVEVGGIVMVDAAHHRQWHRMSSFIASERLVQNHTLCDFYREEIETMLDPTTNDEHMDIPTSIDQLEGTTLGDIPLIVLTAGKAEWEPDFPEDIATQIDQDWLILQRDLTALSTRGVQYVIPDSGHCMHGDRPDAVVDAVLRLINLASVRD